VCYLYVYVGGQFIGGELANTRMLLVTSVAYIKDLCSLFEIYIFSSIFIDRCSAVLTRGRVTVYCSALNNLRIISKIYLFY
jgi:hypothetical protein